ncbi:uncharacterized protein At2g39795, mitochondrial-like [Phalaenopsis equestris]|uniref:uncharacterized protein At2g39795, mitochondrial-like n=1 Tax=Phalaenopsis equestris TaxID=78828 RepID=UPI0009E379DA|nr:uncharacterized protein At2g39795, mitochondrial-like [Phalaenopsis equestris]
MASPIARPFLRGAAYRQLSFVFSARHRHTLCYSYLTASSSLVQSALIQKLQKTSSSLFLRFASSKVGGVDESLLKVLQSEISCIQEIKEPRELEVPEGFPFEIIDNSGDNTITLKREFAGESIQVIVYMNPDEEEDEEEEDEDEDTDHENEFKPSISLLVAIDKGDSPILEFSCSLNSDELLIESMARRNHDDSDGQGAYQGPAFSDLDESLRKGLHNYLKVRGISSDSLYGFLYEYMTIKDEREYQTWLKNIHDFVRK